MTDFSIEAQVLLGSLWKWNKRLELNFQRSHIINPKTRKGLDELTEKGFLELTELGTRATWTPTDKMKDTPAIPRSLVEQNSFTLTVPEEDTAK